MDSLTDEALSNLASYLTKTTRALFAASLTAPAKSWERAVHVHDELTQLTLSPQSRVVMDSRHYGPCISNKYECEFWEYEYSYEDEKNKDGYKEKWAVLNFMDIEEHVRMRLTDGDIAGVLICIDGVNNVKTMRLPSCINVTGSFWRVLHGSRVLETVDVGLCAPDDDHSFYEEIKLSADNFVALLNSIFTNEERKLRRIHVPHEWYNSDNPLANDSLAKFIKENIEMNLETFNAGNFRIEHRVGCHFCNRRFSWRSCNHESRIICSVERGDKLICCPDEDCCSSGCDVRCCLDDHKFESFHCDNCNETRRYPCSYQDCCENCKKVFCTKCSESEEGDSGMLYCGLDCSRDGFCRGCTLKGEGNLRVCIRCENAWCSCTEFVLREDGLVCEECRDLPRR